MIQLERLPKPQQLEDNEENLTQEFLSDCKKAVWKKSYIKDTLLAMSNGKCCYCERKIGHGDTDMHIEHFLPKSIYPNLVVNWNNLLPSCSYCNRQKLDHDPQQEPIINPVDNNPKEFFYLRNYRYYCFDNSENSIARRTLSVLSLNDTINNVDKRYTIGEALLDKIDDILEMIIGNESVLKEHTIKRNKVCNGCKNILRQGLPSEVYSAFMSTLIIHNANFQESVDILKRLEIWDDELEELFQVVNNNAFKISREN